MARNLWRPRQLGLPLPVLGLAAGLVVLLIVVIVWVRGCQGPEAPPAEEQDQPAQQTQTTQGTEPGPTTIDTTPSEPSQTEPPVQETKTPTLSESYWDAGRLAFDQGDYLNARDQLSLALKGIRDPGQRRMIQQQLTTIANELTFSPRVKKGDLTVQYHHVKAGDYPAGVVKPYNITAELFMKINNIRDARSMRADKDYKVINGPFNVVVHKKTFLLDVFLKDYYIKSYQIGLGRDNSTPLGTFLAGSKMREPSWIGVVDENGRREIVPYGDPRNPLGDHWISLKELPKDGAAGKDTTYGIHGTTQPQTIGTQASLGCIRMRNAEVADLFDLLVEGKSQITIMDD